ncbi:helix-turn-helix transcriptional regulator [Leptospira meyeri]|uniref:helix-turn-helix transcriptional regulator n=1 Tax=Leptospira meyeri TaxID=29508 RepID=UPI0010846532|nr:helix-turn-helix transcriptional regulator [Leptospira meyeri]TGL14501.1 XRE family transcriptional regulator [Leptospira meyeri]
MQAVVKTHHIKITVEAERIPTKLMNFLKKEFGKSLKVSKDNLDEEDTLEVKKTKWYKEIKNQITPGDNLKIYRQNKGLSQGKLAKMLDILPSNISEMERGKRGISKDIAKKLSVILETRVEKFI